MLIRRASMLIALTLSAQAAVAGPFSDDLGRCFVSSTSPEDRIALARWIFIAFSGHPAVAPLITVKPGDIESANAQVGDLFMRLLLTSCRDQAKKAIKFEGPTSLQSSFQTLGQVAGIELASTPEAQARMSGFAKHVDEVKLKALIEEP
jgi:hypothetical protein